MLFNRDCIKGLYAVTPDIADTAQLAKMVEASLQGGVDVLQYRNKTADSKLRIKQAQALLALCRQYQVPLIINDHVKLCLALDADGVHIGADDGNIAAVKARIGDKILGASCYNRLDLAQAAKAAGADYVAFGACFPSSTKPNAVKADLSLFQADLGLPIVAIGGITLDNAKQAIKAGASAIAVINALYGAEDVKLQVNQFRQMIDI